MLYLRLKFTYLFILRLKRSEDKFILYTFPSIDTALKYTYVIHYKFL